MIGPTSVHRLRQSALLRRIAAKQHPVVLQYPSQSLLRPVPVNNTIDLSSPATPAILDGLTRAREHYEYPGLSAVQIGWNLAAFVINITPNAGSYTLRADKKIIHALREAKEPDDNVRREALAVKENSLSDFHLCLEPNILWESHKRSWTWEACASCCFLMHYIERPTEIIATWRNVQGQTVIAKLAGMGSRLFQHEMDHIRGEAFYQRIPNTAHAVPLAGFRSMSMWKSDFPSIEARSTYLYSLFTPPFTFRTETPPQSTFIDRTFDEEVYPGIQHDEEMWKELSAGYARNTEDQCV